MHSLHRALLNVETLAVGVLPRSARLADDQQVNYVRGAYRNLTQALGELQIELGKCWLVEGDITSILAGGEVRKLTPMGDS